MEDILSTTIEQALAKASEVDVSRVPQHLGLGFERRRDELWALVGPDGPELGRVLDVAPDGALRPKPLTGVDAVEVDLAFLNRQNKLRGAKRSGRYSHVVLTGILERVSRDRLTSLLTWMHRATAADAVLVMDGPVIEGGRLPDAKRWAYLSLTTTRTGAPRHHHLEEIELAVLESDWLIADVKMSSLRRSRVKLVKQAARREDWLMGWERRAVHRGGASSVPRFEGEDLDLEALEREVARARDSVEQERLRHRLAYEALLRENASLREGHHAEIARLNDEIRRLRELRSARGWVRFQLARLRPARVVRGIRRRLRSRLRQR